MKLYYAPMEGVTSCQYRRVHAEMFPGVDKYFAPFIAPDSEGRFKPSHLRDLLPENNPLGAPVPQLLCSRALPFLQVCESLRELGYGDVNLNLGCPSGTVTAKHKGAGLLADLGGLDALLEEIFSRCSLRVSLKTRMGTDSAEELPALMEIYRKYPLSELIIHTRTRSGMYKSPADPEAFFRAVSGCAFSVCYNGSIFTPADMARLAELGPAPDAVMLGRGAAANPALFRQLRGGEALSRRELRDFHDALLEELLRSGYDSRCAMARMKELWYYTGCMFPGSERLVKAVVKARSLEDYRAAAAALFAGGSFDPGAGFGPGGLVHDV